MATTARRAPPPPPEPPAEESSKRAAFKRIAEPRLANVIEDMKFLGQTADKNRYDFGEGDILFIQTKLEEAVAELISQFRRGNPRPDIKFPD